MTTLPMKLTQSIAPINRSKILISILFLGSLLLLPGNPAYPQAQQDPNRANDGPNTRHACWRVDGQTGAHPDNTSVDRLGKTSLQPQARGIQSELQAEQESASIQHRLTREQIRSEEDLLLPADVQLHAGDLIFRQSDSTIGYFVHALQVNPVYSHVGIIQMAEGRPFVIHVVPLNPDGSQVVQYEPLETFISGSTRIGIFRLKSGDETLSQKAAEIAYDAYRTRATFDQAFDLQTDRKLYCTELVWKAFRQVGVDLVEDDSQWASGGPMKSEIIFPSDMSRSSFLYPILSVERKSN